MELVRSAISLDARHARGADRGPQRTDRAGQPQLRAADEGLAGRQRPSDGHAGQKAGGGAAQDRARAAKNGAHIAAATGQELGKEVSGDGKRSLRGRARARVLPVLRRAHGPLGGAQYPAAKPAAEQAVRAGRGARAGAARRLRRAGACCTIQCPTCCRSWYARPLWPGPASNFSWPTSAPSRRASSPGLRANSGGSRCSRKARDIYCASASQMFHVPVEKHGMNGHLRQKGKIAELALGYGGGVGALKAMGALEMGLKEEELKPLVDAWRAANPMIVKLWWEVDEAITIAIRTGQTTPRPRHPLRLSVWYAVYHAPVRAAAVLRKTPPRAQPVRRHVDNLHGHKRRETMDAAGELRPEIRREHRAGAKSGHTLPRPCRRCGTALSWRMSTTSSSSRPGRGWSCERCASGWAGTPSWAPGPAASRGRICHAIL